MARYERGDLTTSTASGSAALEFRAAATDSAYVKEIGLFLNAATATLLGLGKPGNTPAGGTVGLGQAINSGATGVDGVVLSGWTTAPTVPPAYYRQIGLPNAIGNGIIWTWQGDGLLVPAGASLVVWNLQLNSALRYYICWEE